MLITQGDIDPTGLCCIKALLQDRVCRTVVYRQSTESTNSLALRDCQAGLDHDLFPRLYMTDDQTAGRGRLGRRWYSSDCAITFSLVIHCDRPPMLLPIAVGVGVARSIEFTYAPLRVRLKWPNDVYINQGKVAGILIETNQSVPDRVVIGVGINVNGAPDVSELTSGDKPDSLVEAKSIASAIGRPVPRYEILPSVVSQIAAAIAELAETESTVLADFRSRCVLTDQQISFGDATGRRTGICLGINDRGELAVKTGDQIHHCRSGEAHRVRIQRPPPGTPH